MNGRQVFAVAVVTVSAVLVLGGGPGATAAHEGKTFRTIDVPALHAPEVLGKGKWAIGL